MLTLHPSGTRPLYEQITETLQREIADGTLPAGTRLPSSRQLARDLRVSRITVVTAYAELEAAGAIEARGGSGTYVLPPWTSPRPGGPSGEAAASLSAPALPLWQRDLVHPVNVEREATLGHVLRGPLTPDTIGFAWGAGDPRLIPMTEFRRALAMSSTVMAPRRSVRKVAQAIHRYGIGSRPTCGRTVSTPRPTTSS